MTALVCYGLLAYGLIVFLTESSIFGVVRILVSPHLPLILRRGMYCPMCVGFWVGIGLGALHAYPGPLLLNAPVLEAGILSMAIGTFWGWLRAPNPAQLVEQPHVQTPQESENE